MEGNEIVFKPIGVIRTPYKEKGEVPKRPAYSADRAEVILNPELEPGLSDLEGFSHIMLIFHLHKSEGFELRIFPRDRTVKRGLFSTRSPRRPNPIAVSITRLIHIEKNVLIIEGIDALDGSPLLDIKPYIPAMDSVEDVSTGWIENKGNY